MQENLSNHHRQKNVRSHGKRINRREDMSGVRPVPVQDANGATETAVSKMCFDGMARQLRAMGRIIHYCFLALVCGFILRADNVLTIPLDDRTGIDQGVVVTVKAVSRAKFELVPLNCPTAWCVIYEIRRYGRNDILERPLSIKLQFDQGGLCKGTPASGLSPLKRLYPVQALRWVHFISKRPTVVPLRS